MKRTEPQRWLLKTLNRKHVLAGAATDGECTKRTGRQGERVVQTQQVKQVLEMFIDESQVDGDTGTTLFSTTPTPALLERLTSLGKK